MNATSNDKGDTTSRELSRHDFGMGLLAGLHTKGVATLDDRDAEKVHASFLEAFKVVEHRLGREHLRFSIITHRIYGTSADVYNIFSYWLGLWATKDAPGTIWRFNMTDQSAERLFAELRGGRELYVEAAEAFLLCYRGYK